MAFTTGCWLNGGGGGGGPTRIDSAPYRRLGLECELAVVLGQGLLPGRTDRAAAATAVGSVHPAVELVDDRYDNFGAGLPGPHVWIADDFFHCGSVLGPAMDVPPDRLNRIAGQMTVNGESVGAGTGADIIDGHPLEALVWLANSAVAEEMGGLPPGWIVSLGSVTKTHWVHDCLPPDREYAASAEYAACGGRPRRTVAGVEVRVEFGFEDGVDGGPSGLLDLWIDGGPGHGGS